MKNFISYTSICVCLPHILRKHLEAKWVEKCANVLRQITKILDSYNGDAIGEPPSLTGGGNGSGDGGGSLTSWPLQ